MAAPHVAGLAALLWSRNPDLTYRQVKEIILSTVDPVDSLKGKTVTGGRLNAFKAVTLLTESPSPGPETRIKPVAVCKISVKDFIVTLDATDSFGDIKRYNWIISSMLDAIDKKPEKA
jgi:hypothetical protein